MYLLYFWRLSLAMRAQRVGSLFYWIYIEQINFLLHLFLAKLNIDI